MHSALNTKNISTASIKTIISSNNQLAPLLIRDRLFTLIPEKTKYIYVIGVGSNRISGDSLGPFVGTLLANHFPEHLTAIGTLKHPLDASTLEHTIHNMNFPDDCFIIAIDSVLGPYSLVPSIAIQNHSIQPGEVFGNSLPAIGDCGIVGVVEEYSPSHSSSLLTTDLHLIYSMAHLIAKGILLTVRQYFQYSPKTAMMSFKN